MPRDAATKKAFRAARARRRGPSRARVSGPSGEPMIIATGVDLVELRRVERLLAKQRDRFLERVFTPGETEHCLRQTYPARSFGARFAAKEAAMKCLGTGWAKGVTFTQVEVVRVETGAVRIELSGRAAEVARELRIARIHLSLSHTDDHAMAFAVAEA